MYHTNIRSLQDKYDMLLEHLANYKKKPDIIAISDNYLHSEDVNQNMLPITGYTTHHMTDVTMYTNQNLNTTQMNEITVPNVATNIIQIHANRQKTNPIHTIIGIYRRPHSDPDFIKNLQSAIDQIYTKSPTTSITIIGDMNFNLLSPSNSIINFLTENEMNTTITTPTRCDPHHNTKTLIDVVLTTLNQTAATAGTISPPLADHLAIYTIFHNNTPKQQKHTSKQLSLSRYQRHKDKILPDLQAAVKKAQETTLPTDTTAQYFHNLQTELQRAIEKHEKKSKPRRKAWCTPRYRRRIRKQHELYKQRTEQLTPENIRKHAEYRNRLKKDIQREKRNTLISEIDQAKRDPKRRAEILRSLNPKGSSQRTSPTEIHYEDTTYTDPTDIANALNDHYITIGQKTTQAIPKRERRGAEDREGGEQGDDGRQERGREEAAKQHKKHPPFQIQQTTEEKVSKTIKEINPNKASDIYKIKPAMIKDLEPMLTPILTSLFNKAIDENEYPDPLKLTKVIEIYKAKQKTIPANYRPISLLPIIAKILDTIINEQLMTHLLKHNILSRTQYAFRPDSNTTLALQAIIGDIQKHITKHKPVLGIYIDLSKAYDTIEHEKLLHKLENEFNFTPETLQFFRTYFRNRQQSTHTQHAQSETKTITHGIPQGSTLSTTFFLLYVNNIIETVPASKVFTYADDTTLVITAMSVRELQLLAQSELSDLINYFHDNNLVPNATKTNFTVFHPVTKHQQIQLKINDTFIEHNTDAKLLGVYVQNNLKNHRTITNIIRKLQPTIFNFRRATKLLPAKYMRNEYFTHIYPHLITNISIWGTSNPAKTYIQPLVRLQKKIVRILKNVPPGTHTKPLMTELGILNITNLYILRVAAEMHPHIYPKQETNRPDHFHNYTSVAQIHEHATRQSLKRQHYIPNTNQYSASYIPDETRNHFTDEFTAIWNTLPLDIRAMNVLRVFKKNLNQYLLKQQSQKP